MSKIDIKAMIKDLKKNELTELISVAQAHHQKIMLIQVEQIGIKKERSLKTQIGLKLVQEILKEMQVLMKNLRVLMMGI